jgi:hypothetical protein
MKGRRIVNDIGMHSVKRMDDRKLGLAFDFAFLTGVVRQGRFRPQDFFHAADKCTATDPVGSPLECPVRILISQLGKLTQDVDFIPQNLISVALLFLGHFTVLETQLVLGNNLLTRFPKACAGAHRIITEALLADLDREYPIAPILGSGIHCFKV